MKIEDNFEVIAFLRCKRCQAVFDDFEDCVKHALKGCQMIAKSKRSPRSGQHRVSRTEGDKA